MIKKIVKSPYLNFFSGLILLITSAYEVWESFGEESIGAHHGVMLFSLIHIVKSIPHMMEGFTQIEEAKTQVIKSRL